MQPTMASPAGEMFANTQEYEPAHTTQHINQNSNANEHGTRVVLATRSSGNEEIDAEHKEYQAEHQRSEATSLHFASPQPAATTRPGKTKFVICHNTNNCAYASLLPRIISRPFITLSRAFFPHIRFMAAGNLQDRKRKIENVITQRDLNDSTRNSKNRHCRLITVSRTQSKLLIERRTQRRLTNNNSEVYTLSLQNFGITRNLQ